MLAVGEEHYGAVHRYEFFRHPDGAAPGEAATINVGVLQFQQGPRFDPSSIPGVITVAVLAALIDHHEGFQRGPFPSEENKMVIAHLKEAMRHLRNRADERAARGVLGKAEK